jgi:hypothetical protein
MHLTNYAIQKRSEDFIRDEETGTKRYVNLLNQQLAFNDNHPLFFNHI